MDDTVKMKSTLFVIILQTIALWGTTATSPSTIVIAKPQTIVCHEDYIVQHDDRLSKVSAKYYHDRSAYPAIFEATTIAAMQDDSYATITDVDLIEVGWKLCIPNYNDALSLLNNLWEVTSVPENYTIYQRFPLTQTIHGISGTLQLLEDARLSDELRQQMWFVGDISYSPEFVEKPLLPKIVRLVNLTGQPVMSRTLERGLAKIAETSLYNETNKPTYLLTVDYSVGWGGSNGPITFLVEVNGGNLEFLNAIDEKTGDVKPIRLVDALRWDWQIAPTINGTSKDILKVGSHYDFSYRGEDRFETRYIRFYFDGYTWKRLSRAEVGYWEQDRPFPTIALFP